MNDGGLRAPLFGRCALSGIAALQQAEPFAVEGCAPAFGKRLGVENPLAQPQLHPVGPVEEAFFQPRARFEPAFHQNDLLVRAQFGEAAGIQHHHPAARARTLGKLAIDVEAQRLLVAPARVRTPALGAVHRQGGAVRNLAGGEAHQPELRVFLRRKRFRWLPSGGEGGKQQRE